MQGNNAKYECAASAASSMSSGLDGRKAPTRADRELCRSAALSTAPAWKSAAATTYSTRANALYDVMVTVENDLGTIATRVNQCKTAIQQLSDTCRTAVL